MRFYGNKWMRQKFQINVLFGGTKQYKGSIETKGSMCVSQ